MNAQLALALLALGSLKTGTLDPKPVSGTARPAESVKLLRDPIAQLAREWLSKR